MSITEAQHYELVMRDARDNVFLVAVRQAIDTRLLVVEFDADREPGLHPEHTLAIAVRDTHPLCRQSRRHPPRMASCQHRFH